MPHMETTGRWLGADGWFHAVCHHDAHIHSLTPVKQADEHTMFIPAPLDLHVHGGGGADVMQGDGAIRTVLDIHAQHGTGALLATSVTAPFEHINDFIASAQRVIKTPMEGQANLLGVHLEGPFISPERLGAQPNYPATLDLAVLQGWLETGVVKVVTYAPELDELHQVPALCRRYGARAQIGHTGCHWSQASRALASGAGATHLFNAMSPVAHRDGGAAVAVLAYADFAEIITDGIHVDRAAFDTARRALSGLYSVTDATAAAGMPDGEYQLGSVMVTKVGGRVVLSDGTLAGSSLTQQRSIEVLSHWGLDWLSIANLISAVPARWLGTTDYGVIASGARANWLEVNDQGAVALWLDGKRQALAPLA